MSDRLVHAFTHEKDESAPFLREILKLAKEGQGRKLDIGDVARGLFVGIVSTAALYSKAVTILVDRYLGGEGEGEEFVERLGMCGVEGKEGDVSRVRVRELIERALSEWFFFFRNKLGSVDC